MSFIDGLRTGSSIVQGSIDNAARAREWRERLSEKKDAKNLAAQARKTEADRYADTRSDKTMEMLNKAGDDLRAAEKNKTEEARWKASEAHMAKQDTLIDEQIRLSKMGLGLNGRGGTQKNPALDQANKNLENARKAMASYTSSGTKPPPQLESSYHAALADVDRLSVALGLNPSAAAVVPPQSAHPATWIDQFVGGGSNALPAKAETVDPNDYRQFIGKFTSK